MRYLIMLNKIMMGIVFSLAVCTAQVTFAMDSEDCKYDRGISYQLKENAEREVVTRLMAMKKNFFERLDNFSSNVSSGKWIVQNDPEGYDSHRKTALKLSLSDEIKQNLQRIKNSISLAGLSTADEPNVLHFLSTLETNLRGASDLEVDYKMIIQHKLLYDEKVNAFQEAVKNLQEKQAFPKDEAAACLAIYPQYNGKYPTELKGYIKN